MNSSRIAEHLARFAAAIATLALATSCATPGNAPSEASETTEFAERAPEAPSETAADDTYESTTPSAEATPPTPQEQPAARAVNEQERELGRQLLPLVAGLGFTEYAYATRSASGVLRYEYLPEGESLDSWRHLCRIGLLKAGETWEAGMQALPTYTDRIARSVPGLIEAGGFEGSGSNFLHYRATDAPLPEDVMVVIWQVLPGTLARLQVHQRPEAFSERKIMHFKEVAFKLGLPPQQQQQAPAQ